MDDRSKTKGELIAELEALRTEIEALRQSERELLAAQRIAGVGNWQWNTKTKTTTWSDETYRIHGIEPGTPLPLWDRENPYIHPDDRDIYRNLLEKTRSGFSFEIDLRIIRPDGEIRYIEARGEPGIFDEKGELIGLFGTVLDVTDRKRVEEKLRQSEFALREAQKVAHVGSWQWNRETDRVVWSEEIYRIHGLDPRDPPPRGQENYFVHPEDRDIHRQIVIASQKGKPYDVDLRIIRPDGEIRYIEARGAPGTVNDRGELIGLFGTVLDVTDRKRIEANLKEYNRRWRSLLDHVQLMVIGLDRAGYVEYVNPFFLRVTGYEETEVLGRCWFTDFIPPESLEESKQRFSRSLETDSLHFHHDEKILTRSGGERLVTWNNTILRDSEGERIGTIGIGDDITEKQALERPKTEFISVVSHELRTPLTSMQVALSLLDTGAVDPVSADGRQMIRVASEGVDRLVRLVNDLLDLERLESGKVRLYKRPCSPAILIDTAIEQVKGLADSRDIHFRRSATERSIEADADRLVQVLTNLLGNAIRFSPPGSTIEIATETLASSGIVLFTVKDNGRGIPEDKLKLIFERFVQVDTSDSRERNGTGLGLAICRGIINQHRGKIWVESKIGRGSSFYFTIPLADRTDDAKKNLADR